MFQAHYFPILDASYGHGYMQQIKPQWTTNHCFHHTFFSFYDDAININFVKLTIDVSCDRQASGE